MRAHLRDLHVASASREAGTIEIVMVAALAKSDLGLATRTVHRE